MGLDGKNNKWDMDGKRKGKETGAAKALGFMFMFSCFFEYFLGAKLVALRLMPFCFCFYSLLLGGNRWEERLMYQSLTLACRTMRNEWGLGAGWVSAGGGYSRGRQAGA